MSKNKTIDKKQVEDFLEVLTSKKEMSKEELDAYIGTFTKYLNSKIDGAEKANKVCCNDIKHKKKKFKLHKPMIKFIVMLVLLVILIASNIVPIILHPESGLNYNNNIPLSILYTIISAICLINVIKLLINYNLVYRNCRKIKVGQTVFFDPIAARFEYYISDDFKKSFDLDSKSFCTVCTVTAITNKFIRLLNMSDGNIFDINVKYANLFTPVDLSKTLDSKVILRYPYEYPMFDIHDEKSIEAALILAHEADNKEAFDAISDVAAKIRFYSNNPYGLFSVIKQEYDKKRNEAKEFLNSISTSKDSVFDLDSAEAFNIQDEVDDFFNSIENDDDYFDEEDA